MTTPPNEKADIVVHPTLADVAAVAGVSIKTASRVLNDQANVTVKTATKVREAANLLGYRTNAIARELRGGHMSNLVGMVISDLFNPFYAGLASGAEERLTEAGHDLIIATARDDEEREAALIDSLLSRRVRGLLVVPSGKNYSHLHAERRRGFSFVFVDRPAPFFDADNVLVDNNGGMYECVKYFEEKGLKRIVLIADQENIWTAGQRIAGFNSAVTRCGLSKDDCKVISGVHTEKEAMNKVIELVNSQQPIDGIIAANDLIAQGVFRGLRTTKKNIPIISFDDFPQASLLGVPTLDHDPQTIGRIAAGVLLDRFSNPAGENFITTMMQLRLKEGVE